MFNISLQNTVHREVQKCEVSCSLYMQSIAGEWMNKWLQSVGGKIMPGEKPQCYEKHLSQCRFVHHSTMYIGENNKQVLYSTWSLLVWYIPKRPWTANAKIRQYSCLFKPNTTTHHNDTYNVEVTSNGCQELLLSVVLNKVLHLTLIIPQTKGEPNNYSHAALVATKTQPELLDNSFLSKGNAAWYRYFNRHWLASQARQPIHCRFEHISRGLQCKASMTLWRK